MKVYKFGGASVKSAKAIENLGNILTSNNTDLMIVISAMDKTTNALENILLKYINYQDFTEDLKKVTTFHLNIINQLFKKPESIIKTFNKTTKNLQNYLSKLPSKNYDKNYDAIVSFGELISTQIISDYLNKINIQNIWLDARKIIKTDNNFRAASVNFEATKQKLAEKINFSEQNIYITQGFIASNFKEETTTLGREGSDYTASVIANLLNAENLTLWKDVAGIFNADPKIKQDAKKLKKISYREATELAYFGAKVIHPKTTKPLIANNIPLIIRSFNNINEEGTTVANFDEKVFPKIPIYIYSDNQVLVTINSNNFIDEHIFEKVFSIFRKFNTKINLLQNSALTLSLCFNYNKNNFNSLISTLKQEFKIKYNNNLTLLTIRHYNSTTINNCTKNKNIILEQKNRLNAFFLMET